MKRVRIEKLVVSIVLILFSVLVMPQAWAEGDIDVLRAAHRGNVNAMRRIGMRMYRGCSVGNPSAGIQWLERAAEKGDVEAMYDLGRIYQSKKDYGRAAEYLKQAAEQGHSKASERLEKLPLEHSLELVEKKAKSGNYKACMRLLKAYLLGGEDIQIDADNAWNWYEQAAKLKAQETRETIKKWNASQTVSLWEKIVDKNRDDEEVLMYLAELYEKGADGLMKDEEKAKKYYQRAATSGNLQAVAWLKERGISFETKAERDARLAREAEAKRKAEAARQERERREQEMANEKHRDLFRSLLRDHGRERANFLCCYGDANPYDEEISLGKLSTMNEFSQFYLSGRVYQKISDSRFLALANGTTISVVVPPDVKINFADKDLVHGIFMRDGSYSYETVSGQWKEVRNYIIVAGSN